MNKLRKPQKHTTINIWNKIVTHSPFKCMMALVVFVISAPASNAIKPYWPFSTEISCNHSEPITSHVSYQAKQHHNSSITKLESGTRVDQQPARRCRAANDPGCLVALSDKTRYNQHMYQILKNGTLLVNAQDLQTAVVYVKSLEHNLDRATQHSPYTIVRVEE